MKVTQNIGIVNSLIRIMVGFTILTWCTAKLVKKPWRESYLLMAMLGGMKIAEGIVRFCPITALFERGQDMMGDHKDSFPDIKKEPKYAEPDPGPKKSGGNKGFEPEVQNMVKDLKNSGEGDEFVKELHNLEQVLSQNPNPS